jgi:hypothetical protein
MSRTFPSEELVVSKPRKSENNTYTCQVSMSKKGSPLTIPLDNATIVCKKSINGQNFLFIKNKEMYNFFYDLSVRTIEIVKSRCTEWFNNRMNTELIEDYYVNNLVYDKKYGDIIKVKCIGDDNTVENQKCNIQLCVEQLRFFKQKFVLECSISSFESVQSFIEEEDASDDGFFEEEEVPFPDEDEIQAIRDEYLAKIDEALVPIKEQIDSLRSRANEIEGTRQRLVDSDSLDKVMKMCEDLEILCG